MVQHAAVALKVPPAVSAAAATAAATASTTAMSALLLLLWQVLHALAHMLELQPNIYRLWHVGSNATQQFSHSNLHPLFRDLRR
jgi:hypothetical protein